LVSIYRHVQSFFIYLVSNLKVVHVMPLFYPLLIIVVKIITIKKLKVIYIYIILYNESELLNRCIYTNI